MTTKAGAEAARPPDLVKRAFRAERPNELNRFLRGWAAYFSYGTPLQSFRNVDVHVAHRARNFLRRRHRLPASSRRLSWAALHQEHGILLLYGLLQPHAVT